MSWEHHVCSYYSCARVSHDDEDRGDGLKVFVEQTLCEFSQRH